MTDFSIFCTEGISSPAMVPHYFEYDSNQRWEEVRNPYHTRCWSEVSSVSIVMSLCAGGARIWILSDIETCHFATLSLVTTYLIHSLIRRVPKDTCQLLHEADHLSQSSADAEHSCSYKNTLPNFGAQWLIKHRDNLNFAFNTKCWSRHKNETLQSNLLADDDNATNKPNVQGPGLLLLTFRRRNFLLNFSTSCI